MKKCVEMTNIELVENLIYYSEDVGSSATSGDDLELAKNRLPKLKQEILRRMNSSPLPQWKQ